MRRGKERRGCEQNDRGRTTLSHRQGGWRAVGRLGGDQVFMPWHGGYEPACIKGVDDLAETMTLATSVIAGKKRFVPDV